MSSVAAMWSPMLFGFALFLSTGLLFIVQPMIGRTLLPHLGGNQLAWNACLVFFQATLLAGYLYADLLHRFRGLRWQPWVQILLLALATFLCFTGLFGENLLNDLAPRFTSLDTWPVFSTICLLVIVIGLPFLVLAAVGPLLLRWFAHLEHPKASDPYFLFVASNLGALTALVIYPTAIEPNAPMYAQWMSWKLSLTALGFLLLLVAICAWASPRNPEMEPPKTDDPNAPRVPKLIGRGLATPKRRLFWLIASALPVGLMMGVTDFLTLDVAPAPMLWALPLILYVLAFGQSFARWSPLDLGGFTYKLVVQILYGLVLAICMTVMVTYFLSERGGNLPFNADSGVGLGFCFCLILIAPQSWFAVLQPATLLLVVLDQANRFPSLSFVNGLLVPGSTVSAAQIAMHLMCFYTSARLCLGMLADDRPAAPAVTTYFIEIGVGGLVGGLFQLIVAPFLFRHGYLEFSLLAALASMMRPAWTTNGLTDWALCTMFFPKKDSAEPPTPARRRIAFGCDIGFALAVAAFAAGLFLFARGHARPTMRMGAAAIFADFALVLAVFVGGVLFLRPLRFGLAMTAIVLLSVIGQTGHPDEKQLVRQRTSWGMVRVTERTKDLPRDAANPFDPDPLRQATERTLWHGNAIHGSAIVDPPELRRFPTNSAHELGPAGRLMLMSAWFSPINNNNADWRPHHRNYMNNDARIAASIIGMGTAPLGTSPFPMDTVMTAWSEPPYAVVGMGPGALHAYAHPYQWVDAYEIDPAIVALSTATPAEFPKGGPETRKHLRTITLSPDEALKAKSGEKPIFHYVLDAQERGVQGQIFVGDARRSLSKPGREGFYHMILVDVSSSQAIPVHLLTEEAFVIYFQKLAPEGVLCIHTTNKNVDLVRVLQRFGERLDLPVRVLRTPPSENVPSFTASEWVVFARDDETMNRWVTRGGLDRFDAGGKGNMLDPFHRVRGNVIWTDDQASSTSALRDRLAWPALIYTLLTLIMIFGLCQGVIEMIVATTTPVRRTAPTPRSVGR